MRAPLGTRLACRLAQLPVVLCDGLLIAGRHVERPVAADRRGLTAPRRTAQLQLQPIHVAQHAAVELLLHRGITGKAPRIETLHRANQLLDLALALRIIADCAPERAELPEALPEILLRIDARISVRADASGCGASGRIRSA